MNSRKTHHILRIFLLSMFIAIALPALAQETVTDDEVNDVAKDLFCPVCESTPLDVCPTLACADWRELIRTQLAEGKSKDEIHDYFARQYGDGVLADPPKRGFNLILWLLPIAAFIIAGFFFARYLKILRVAGQQNTTPTATVRPDIEDNEQGDPSSEPSPQEETSYVNKEDNEQGDPSSEPSPQEETSYVNKVEEELKKL